MILLRNKRILFLKPKKVAGTSFEIAMSRYADDNDIITPISPEDEEVRKKLGFRGPQGFEFSLNELAARSPRQAIRVALGGAKPRKFFNHISAAKVREYLGAETFDACLKVSIVRNPFDKLVSQYHWRFRNNANPPTFESWIEGNPSFVFDSRDQYYIMGKEIIDYYIRYESLEEDMTRLEKERPELLGLWENFRNQRAKSQIRPAKSPVETYFANADLVGTVRFFNREHIERFGYGIGH